MAGSMTIRKSVRQFLCGPTAVPGTYALCQTKHLAGCQALGHALCLCGQIWIPPASESPSRGDHWFMVGLGARGVHSDSNATAKSRLLCPVYHIWVYRLQ